MRAQQRQTHEAFVIAVPKTVGHIRQGIAQGWGHDQARTATSAKTRCSARYMHSILSHTEAIVHYDRSQRRALMHR